MTVVGNHSDEIVVEPLADVSHTSMEEGRAGGESGKTSLEVIHVRQATFLPVLVIADLESSVIKGDVGSVVARLLNIVGLCVALER